MRRDQSIVMLGGSEPRLARVAAMIADPARARMLCYLMDGHSASAGELAKAARVSAATASGHLGKLVDAEFVTRRPCGRHRYFQLADAEVAHALEGLALFAERGAHVKAWSDPAMVPLRYARRCYGHLAGALGVSMFRWLLREQVLEVTGTGDYRLSSAGEPSLAAIEFDPGVVKRAGRFAYPCLDWSERRDHLAGGLAAALLEHFVARQWLRTDGATRQQNDGAVPLRFQSHRCLTLSAHGQMRLLPLFATQSR